MIGRRDPGAYEPCWCRSGNRFRDCPAQRHRRPRVTRAQFLRDFEESASLETCLHPEAPIGCSAKVIHAHTVQRMGGGLRAIAEKGEVYGFKGHPSFFQKNDLRVVPERIGTRNASTFRGFCEGHDGPLFKAVEDANFEPTQEQLALLNFRVVARRAFVRQVALRQVKKMFEYDGGLPADVQREWFAINYRDLVNAEASLANICALKSLYDGAVMRSEHADSNGFVACFTGPPEFMSADLVPVDYDFDGASLSHPPPPAHLCAYTVAVPEGWVFVLSWRGRNVEAEQIAKSLEVRSHEEKAASIFRYCLEYTDNLFFAPRWWDGAGEEHRNAVVNVLTRRMHPHYLRDRDFLKQTGLVPMTSKFKESRRIGEWRNAAETKKG